jgi:4-amino-4-deoxy-L-arabinose transferase-like glycosyltransferase
MRWLMDANLDPNGDMLEAFAWGRTFEWGTFKHPPLMAWIAALWFRIIPASNVGFHLLAYLSAAVGLWGVYEFAKAASLGRHAMAAALLLSMAFPYSTLAVKFNANTPLLVLWPWIATVFLQSIQAKGDSLALLRAVLLGVLAALAMLGKYYTALFLLGLFVASLLCAQHRRWYSTLWPWVAAAAFILCLLPHLSWSATHDFAAVRYVAGKSYGRVFWGRILEFGFSPLYFWFIPWILCCVITAPASARWRGLHTRLIRSWLPQGVADPLWWMIMMPWTATIAFGLFGFVKLAGPWAITIGFGFPLLWLRNLSAVPHDDTLVQRTIRKGFWAVLATWLLLTPVFTFWEARIGFQNYYAPRQVMAKEVLKEWHKRHPDSPLRWVGGSWPDDVAISFYGEPTIRTVPGLPDQWEAQVNPVKDWASTPGLVLCQLGRVETGVTGPVADRLTACVKESREWLASHGKPGEEIPLRLHREGWQFPLNVEFDYVAFTYIP